MKVSHYKDHVFTLRVDEKKVVPDFLFQISLPDYKKQCH